MAPATRKAEGASPGGRSTEDRPHRGAVSGRRQAIRRFPQFPQAIRQSGPSCRRMARLCPRNQQRRNLSGLPRPLPAPPRRGFLQFRSDRDLGSPSRATWRFRTAAAVDPCRVVPSGPEREVIWPFAGFAIRGPVERGLSGGGHLSILFVKVGRHTPQHCSVVKSQASSASRIILAYRHRGRGRARSVGRTP